MAEVATSYRLVPRATSLPLAGAKALVRSAPISLTAFDNSELSTWVCDLLAARPIDCVFVFSGQMGQYVPVDYAGRLVIDLCDVDSAKFDAYARCSHGVRAWIYAREARLLAWEEKRLARRADATLLISDNESALFRQRIDDCRAKIVTLPNGIDTKTFDPQAVQAHPDLAASPGPHIVFTGQMDYQPNVAAAMRMIDNLMPGIRRRFPDAMFHVVGRAPVPGLLRKDGAPGVRVWGEVPDVRPFLAAADLVAAPLAIARGVQNKVLEAMAMARPVLVTPEAATGIDASDGVEIAIEANDTELVDRACDLLSDGPAALRMAAAARRFVVEHKGWNAALAPLAVLTGRSAEPATRDAA